MHPASFIGIVTTVIIVGLTQSAVAPGRCETMSPAVPPHTIQLPEPRYDGDVSIEHALRMRRSVRSYKEDPLNLSEISQILWSAQGITNPRGFRTAPSAGALYPLELYVVAGNIKNMPPAIYKYVPHDHALVMKV
ncbi:MAG: nitroreductase family protein, partial [Desulfobacterales bacterium]|nr:nitroreductase family protein [Desulfobacterales bacterium]